ncbi:hypothetical protein LFREDSHE_18160 [Shewanella baltica]
MNPLKYLSGYSPDIQQQVQQHLDAGTLPKLLLKRHPVIHSVRSDKALYDYTKRLKTNFYASRPRSQK